MTQRHEGSAGVPGPTAGLARFVHVLERNAGLDPLARLPKRAADVLLASPRTRDVLQGRWLGHALHPLLTDFPLGMWTSAAMLDLAGGRASRPAAQQLVALGVVAAVPTALTGLAEWGETEGPDQRVGLAHAAVNSTALALYSASWACRRADRHRLGVLCGLAGGVVATAGGYLGGHLTLARRVSSRHPLFEADGALVGAGRASG